MRKLALSLLATATLALGCSGSDHAPVPPPATGGSAGDTGGSGGGTVQPPPSGNSSGGSGGSGGSVAATPDAASPASGGTSGTVDAAVASDSAPASDAAAPPASDGGTPPPIGGFTIPPGLTKIFDGTTLMGWTGDTKIWTIDAAEMAIHGKTGNGGQLIKSAGQYDTFRVVLQEKYTEGGPENHMGVCIWGGAGGNGYSGCLDVIPPSGSLWDYASNKQLPGGVGSANNPIKFMWHQVEILANAATGEVLIAVNGKQTTDFKQPGRGKKGPIGLQAHAGASDEMYRDIWVDPAPKELKLLTLTP